MVSTTLCRTGDVCAVRKGTTITEKEATIGEVPVVAGGMKPSYYHDESNRLPGSITISASGANAGFVSYWGCPIWASDCTTVEPKDPAQVSARYVFHYLKSIEATVILSFRRGAAQPHVYARDLQEIMMPLPPIEEQRRIASILDAADALRTKRRLALAKLGTLTQAIFIDMFGDPLSKNGRYEYRSVGDLALNEDAKRVPVKMSDRALVKGIYPYYGASGIIDYVDDYLYEGQRLLVAEDGANLLARSSPVAFLANGKYWVNNHAHVLADNGEANLTFLRQAIESLDLMPFVTGSAQPKLTRKMLDSVAVPAPPRSTQDEFEARVLGLKLVETDSTQGLEYLDALFVSLQHRAFRGEL
jgi:type I restriction enzyme S subunit